LAHKASARGVGVYLTGTSANVKKELAAHGVRPPLVRIVSTIDQALNDIRKREPACDTQVPVS
jgi:SulP family sulfate permease